MVFGIVYLDWIGFDLDLDWILIGFGFSLFEWIRIWIGLDWIWILDVIGFGLDLVCLILIFKY